MARKEASFAQLVAYMEKDSGDRVLYHNFYGHDRMRTDEIVREFEENARALPRRKNGNALYHEILSLNAGHSLTREQARRILADIGQEYLSRRAPGQIAYGALHRDTDHLHLHLCISSNPVGKPNRVRLAKKEFADIQKEVERLVRERYPELNQERVYTKDRDREKVKTASREQSLKGRTGKGSRKEEFAGIVHGLLEYARSRPELEALLARHGLKLYERGNSPGLLDADGKKHRLKTLGLDLHFSAALERFSAPKDQARQEERADRGAPGGKAPPGGSADSGRSGVPPPQPERSERDRRKEDLDRAFSATRDREDKERGR